MNCDEYATSYLSAHADGDLTREEEQAVVSHLGAGAEDGCATCRARLAEENLLKALIRRQAPTVDAPEELKARIRAEIDRLDADPPAPRTATGPQTHPLRRPLLWVPLAAACAIILALFIGSLPGVRRGAVAPGTVSAMTASAAFDEATGALDKFDHPGAFSSNVPSASPGQIATSYYAADLPDEVWDFASAGYAVVGGRVDSLSDGIPATYTLYHGANGYILSMQYRASDFAVPPGAAADHDGHRFYRYKGYSLCLTISEPEHYIGVLATRAPLAALERAVSAASLSRLGK